MKRTILIFLLACVAARAAWCAAPAPGDDLLKQAQTAFSGAKYDEATGLYEKVFAEPGTMDRWYAAEKGIATSLAKKGDLAGAAQAAHVCMDGAPTLQAFDEATMLAANILSAIDGKVDRANQLIAFQQTTPADGAVSPMDAIGYPSMPAREAAMESLRQKAGDNATAARIRAFAFLFTGKPRDALAQFADAFRKSSVNTDVQRSATDLVSIGLRDVRGSKGGLDVAAQFVSFGPNGPDGKPNTSDDIPDPFAKFLPPAPAPGKGGLAGLAADDIAALEKMRDAARLYAGDPFVQETPRRSAFTVLERTLDALDSWDAGWKSWYVGITPRMNARFFDWALFYTCVETAARDRALHFGGARTFWAGFDEENAANGVEPVKGITTARKQLDGVYAALGKITVQKSILNPLKKPASF